MDDGAKDERKDTRSIGGISLVTIVAIFLLFVAAIYFLWASNEDRIRNNDTSPPPGTRHGRSPRCATTGGVGEERMRKAVVELFGLEAPSVRLSLLKNDLVGQNTGRPCEYDAYIRSLKFACERHGAQHDPIECDESCACPATPLARATRFDRALWEAHIGCTQTPRSRRIHFNMTNEKVRNLMYRDEMKEIRSVENNITLAIVWFDDGPEKDAIIPQLPPHLLNIANL